MSENVPHKLMNNIQRHSRMMISIFVVDSIFQGQQKPQWPCFRDCQEGKPIVECRW